MAAREKATESDGYKNYDDIVAMPVSGELYIALMIVFGCKFGEIYKNRENLIILR